MSGLCQGGGPDAKEYLSSPRFRSKKAQRTLNSQKTSLSAGAFLRVPQDIHSHRDRFVVGTLAVTDSVKNHIDMLIISQIE